MLLRAFRRRQREIRQRRLQPMRSAAGTLGAAVHRSGRTIRGDVGGKGIVYSYAPMTEDGRPRARCKVSYSEGPLGINLQIRRRSNSWRRSAVVTGDESFDGLMLVKTTEPDHVLLALDDSVRRQILDLAFDGTLRVGDKAISFSEPTKDPTAAEIDTNVRRLVSVAEAIERGRPASAPT